jgi:hypothetical protein
MFLLQTGSDIFNKQEMNEALATIYTQRKKLSTPMFF